MNDIQHLPAGNRLFEGAPSMRSASPSLRQALADSPFVFDGGPAWRPENALDAAARSGVEDQVSIARRELEQAMEPAPAQWFGKRLPVLWTLFMAARQADPRALTVWMAETAHLLGDVPHDIIAHSIDEAIKTSRHGFIPSVGEIRAIADPMVAERKLQIERLARMVAALEDPEATAAREARRVANRMAADLRDAPSRQPQPY